MKKSNGSSIFVILFLLSFMLALSSFYPTPCYAQENTENITRKDAERSILGSKETMAQMIKEGFSVLKVNDSIKEAEIMFEAQKLVEDNKKTPDYSRVISYSSEVNSIKESAYLAKDMIYSVDKEYEEYRSKADSYKSNTSEVDILMAEMKSEFNDERYDKVIELSERIEGTIAEKDASLTTVNLFYGALSSGIKQFFIDNYKIMLAAIAGILFIFILFWRQIKRLIIKRKIKSLDREKNILLDLIKGTQKGYFESGTVSGALYSIRTKKFAELIRDIDRQLPLLREQIEKTKKIDYKDYKEKIYK